MNGMVTALIDAKPTPGAFPLIKNDDPVFPFRYSFDRAGFRTHGNDAMFADIHTPDEIELPIHDPRPIRPNGEMLDLVF
jgi:hypothetical protein